MTELLDNVQLPWAPGDQFLALRGAGLINIDINGFVAGLAGIAAVAAAETSVALAGLMARMSVAPSQPRQVLMARLIAQLKAVGIWDKLDALWIMASHDAQAARLNWTGATYDLIAVNSPTFVADAGVYGNGASSYFRTGFVSTSATKAVRSSASVGVVVNAGGANDNNCYIGTLQIPGDSTFQGFRIMGRYTGGGGNNHMFGANSINTSAGGSGPMPTTGSLIVSRTSDEALDFYYNGIVSEHLSIASGISAHEMYLCCENFNGAPTFFASDRMSAAFVGGGLTGSEVSALNTAIRQYLDAIGAP